MPRIFDDLNPEAAHLWDYPDDPWDPDRNTDEFIAAMPAWRDHGLLCAVVNLQGGSPEGYSQNQPWHNSAIRQDGSLRPDYMERLERIIDRQAMWNRVPGSDITKRDNMEILRRIVRFMMGDLE